MSRAIPQLDSVGRHAAWGAETRVPFEWFGVVFPVVAWALRPQLSEAQFTWLFLTSLIAMAKCWMWSRLPPGSIAQTWRAFAFWFAWPGMNVRRFFTLDSVSKPGLAEWAGSLAKIVLGIIVITKLVPAFVDRSPRLAGWIGLGGIALFLHFGVFHFLSLVWRNFGAGADRIFRSPVLASSLGDFWGSRWNLAFRDVAHEFIFRPMLARFDAKRASLAVFVVSGLFHELVISLPVRSGFGLPTMYFLVQWVGVMMERSPLAGRLGVRSGLRGRAFAAIFVLAPLPLLFHNAFVLRVVLPTLGY